MEDKEIIDRFIEDIRVNHLKHSEPQFEPWHAVQHPPHLEEIGLEVEQREIVARPRQLGARWTIEAQQDFANPNLRPVMQEEIEMLDAMAEEISKEIDRELLERIRERATSPEG